MKECECIMCDDIEPSDHLTNGKACNWLCNVLG